MWSSLATVAALGYVVLGMADQRPDDDDIRPIGFANCLFYDNFVRRGGDVSSLPDPEKWTIDLGSSYPNGPENWGTGEIQKYTSDISNIQITNNNTLRITPVRTKDGEWTSARIETTKAWDWSCIDHMRVRVQARIKLGDNPKESSLGFWPAFWLLGSAHRGNHRNWPAVGEIDILETANGEDYIRNVVHCGTDPAGVCNERGGIGTVRAPFSRGVWHTVAFEIDRRRGTAHGNESMSWFVDDQLTYKLQEHELGGKEEWDVLVAARKMILLNVAVGGTFPSGMAGKVTPTAETMGGEGASMEVDYVSVWTE